MWLLGRLILALQWELPPPYSHSQIPVEIVVIPISAWDFQSGSRKQTDFGERAEVLSKLWMGRPTTKAPHWVPIPSSNSMEDCMHGEVGVLRFVSCYAQGYAIYLMKPGVPMFSLSFLSFSFSSFLLPFSLFSSYSSFFLFFSYFSLCSSPVSHTCKTNALL